MIDRDHRQTRSIATRFETREDDAGRHITGYFAVFNSTYNIAPGMSESIAPGAFNRTLIEQPDVRALVNHDTTLVLGRTTAGTLTIREDDHGLYGDVLINPKDQDAVNCWERVNRGDVDQCSFGFNITSEETDFRDDGSVHWTIKDLDLFEVSVCTFPAYEATNVQARANDAETLRQKKLEAWKMRVKEELLHGNPSPDASEKD